MKSSSVSVSEIEKFRVVTLLADYKESLILAGIHQKILNA